VILAGPRSDVNSDRTTVLDKLEEDLRAREVTAGQTQALLDRDAALQKEAAALRCEASRLKP
jgi:hypothetical protein